MVVNKLIVNGKSPCIGGFHTTDSRQESQYDEVATQE